MSNTFEAPPVNTPVQQGATIHPLWKSWVLQVQRALVSLGGKPATPNSGLQSVPDGSSRFAVVNGAGMKGVGSVDPNNLALIDFSQSGHQNKIIDELADGTFIKMLSPPAASAGANTSLSQSGTTTGINVGAGTYYLGNKTVNANSGSVDPGSYGTFYIYFDDPAYAGGAETYHATTDITQITRAPGRFYVGKITTSSSGGGSGGGTIGCFTGNTKVLTPNGFVRFDELPKQSFEILNRTGRHWAKLIVHRNSTERLRKMGDCLVTEGHLIHVGSGWVPAREIFHDLAPIQPRHVYNLHVLSNKPEDKHYILENGLTVHNAKP